MSTVEERKQWNQENITQVLRTLSQAGYRAGAIFEAPAGTSGGSVEMWVGPGRVPVIGLQLYAEDMGFELLVPLTGDQNMAKVVRTLEWATTRPEVEAVKP